MDTMDDRMDINYRANPYRADEDDRVLVILDDILGITDLTPLDSAMTEDRILLNLTH